MDCNYHNENLINYCRICGTQFHRGCKDKKAKRDIQKLVETCYNVDVSLEDDQIYPQYICMKCFAQMRRIEAAKGTKYINPSVVVFNWQPHTDNCEICEHFTKCKVGGRPKKSRKNRGRMSGETTTQIVSFVREVAGECLLTTAVNPSRISVSQVDHSHLVCPLCKLLVNGPVQLSCERLVCAECVIQMLQSKGPSASCPNCGAPAASAHFMKCPSMVAELLGNLRVKCDQGCYLSFPLRQLASHEEYCSMYVSPPGKSTMSDITLGEVLASPLDAPLCPDEQQVCTHLVKHALQESGDQSTLILRTGGQVCLRINNI